MTYRPELSLAKYNCFWSNERKWGKTCGAAINRIHYFREARKSSLPQCSCMRCVYQLSTHKGCHFVLVLFLPDSRMRHDGKRPPDHAADRERRHRHNSVRIYWQLSCISWHDARPLCSALTSTTRFVCDEMAEINIPSQKIAFSAD